MKKYLLFISLFGCVAAKSQQLQTSSLYDLQGMVHNPAMAGLLQKGMVGVSYRSQWGGTAGNPKTAMIFGSIDLANKNAGIGGYLYSDVTGPTSRKGLDVSFAKHLKVSDDATFSIGIEARALQYSIDVAKLSQILGNDPVLSTGNKFKADAGFGVSFMNKHWQVGASVSQLIQSKLDYYEGSMTPTEEGKLYRHYYLHGACKWKPDDNTVITPNFLLIYLPNAPTEFQGGVRVEHNEIFWWGLGYRAHQSVMLSAGANIGKKLTVGYGFDLYATPYSVYENGGNAHEIMLRYNMQ